MNVPRGKGPHPVVVTAHGYIDPRVYVSGQGFRREQDTLARNGYVVLHVDYRNHASSDDDPKNSLNLRLGYTEDVINAALAIQKSGLKFVDTERIALLGRSMGGNVALNAIVAQPDVFDAAVLYASTGSLAVDNFNRWQRSDVQLRERIFQTHGSPTSNPTFWKQASARTYFDRIDVPVLMFHGVRDDSCPISWARATVRAMERQDVDVTYVEYPNAGHYFYGEWTPSIRDTLGFLKRTLK